MVAAAVRGSVRTAVSAIIEELLNGMNKLDLLDPSDLDYLDATFKALDSFQMSIAVLKSRINARRNLLLPIHQLPGELFIRILKYAMGFNDDGWHHDPSLSRFHRVAQVSVHWRDTILSSSSFWRTLRDDQDEHLRATVLRLNSSGPLVLRTRASNTAVADAFLERMLPLAPRWQIIAALRRYSDALFSHLQHIPPTLKDLCIIITDDNDTHHFPMTEGFPLRHVDLIRVSIPWDSSRLRNLHTLSLEHLDANQPTIGQIVSILSSSPHLWRLILRNWKHNPHLADDRQRYTDIVMVLPSLTTLFLELVPTAVVNFFIRHTKTTALACLAVETIEPLDAVDAIRPGSTLSDMLKQVLSHPSIKTTSITYDDALETMRIQSRHRPSRPTQLVYWAVVPPGLAITISTRVGALCSSMWQVLADVLDANAPCTSLNFVNRGQAPPLSESDDACLPRRFPVAVLSHLPHLDSITFDKEFNAGPVLKYLGVPKHDENGGVLWLCPRVTTVVIRSSHSDDVEALVTDLKDFIQRRYVEGRRPHNGSLEEDTDDEDPRDVCGSSPGHKSRGDDGECSAEDCRNDESGSQSRRSPTMLKHLHLSSSMADKLREAGGVRDLDGEDVLVTE